VTIRFLQTCSSENPSFPFQAGQVITVTRPAPSMLDAITAGWAEVVREDATERAVVPAGERPEPSAQKPRVKRGARTLH
jgi:hypothetical protein